METAADNTQRMIIHFDLDTFFVSVERLLNSSFIGKPILIGGTSDRGVVASCSYEARAFGVHSAMPMRMARMLCPQAILVRGDYDNYSKYSQMVTDIIAEKAPVYEKASIDEHYLDLTGLEKYFGCQKWSHELREYIIKQTGLPISYGLSSNKTVSKIATGIAKPNGEKLVRTGTEKPFLAPLSIRRIPMVGEKTFTLLRNMGISKIETIQEMPVELMQKVMGENGTTIWKKANGIDNTPVEPYNERKSISTENTFDEDTIDKHRLNEILVSMVEQLAFQLRKENRLTSCITVKLRYSNFETFTRQKKIAYTSLDNTLIRFVKEIFAQLYERRLLVRLIGVKFSHLISGNYQINIFDDTIESIHLCLSMDKIRLKYGEKAIMRSAGL